MVGICGSFTALTAGMALLVIAQQHAVSVRLGDHGAVGLLPGHHGRTTRRKYATPDGSTCCDSRGNVVPLGVFALLRGQRLVPLTPLAEDSLTPWLATAIFVLAIVGFGLKAGIMPFHVYA